MAKKIISDLIINKRSIRQIPISNKKKNLIKDQSGEFIEDNNILNIKEEKKPNSKKRSVNPKFAVWFIAVVCFTALFISLSMLFSSAGVNVNPQIQSILFENEKYTAYKTLNNSSANDLVFDVLEVKQDLSEIVETTAEKEVAQKASGKIIIYNKYSTSPQRLITNTRFEANNGKIYRIDGPVVVPGYKKVDGKIIPGSVEAVVYADQAGESYNLKLSDLVGDFKIPGFKGSVQYDYFYALLKTDITDGYVGTKRIIDDNLRREKEDIIKNKLKEKLLNELYVLKPEDYLVFEDQYFIDYKDLIDTPVDNNHIKINMEGKLTAITFNNAKLAKKFASEKISDFNNLPVEFIISDNLEVVLLTDNIKNLMEIKNVELKFNGPAYIKWSYDKDELKDKLKGKKKTDIPDILDSYQGSILSMEVILKPFWARYFPDNIKKIKIKENLNF